ncbi:MAG: GTP-binding protein [Spirochaetaceae bacterium]|nr:GTP-binding protein [Spirochaetaceae bacterium]
MAAADLAHAAPSQAAAAATAAPPPELPTMNVVVVGHVDHGKSTVVGRLLHDTGVLPHGKIEQVRSNCERSGKPFEYAFLIDALQDEQAQGITIDAARVFFRSDKRRYIIIDAPGHIEFLKNMISGAARAEAAILVIDASEGVRENSRRHGYMAAMLGIRQLLVVVNKMDLVDYDEAVFAAIRDEYETFLGEIEVEPRGFIPVSGRHGDNLVGRSERTPWYEGAALLEQIDAFASAGAETAQALRLPVQDVYKFPTRGDDARIIAGTVATGSVRVGDTVEFLPSRKRARVRSVEGFQVASREQAAAGVATGVTLTEELYVRPGELMYRVGEPAPQVGTTFRCNLFWLGRNPLVPGKRYRLKLATTRVGVHVKEIVQVMDAATLEHSETAGHKGHVGRHEVAECVLETQNPIAFDLGIGAEFAATGRFVLVDEYEIAGGGIVTEYVSGLKASLREHVKQRDYAWVRGAISAEQRIERYQQRPRLVVLTGEDGDVLHEFARDLEDRLFRAGRSAYYLGLTNLARGLDATMDEAAARAAAHADEDRSEHLRRLGEVAHILGDAGQIVITTVTDLDAAEAEILRILNEPNDMLVIRVGADHHAVNADLVLAPGTPPEQAVAEAYRLLREREVVLEYYL